MTERIPAGLEGQIADFSPLELWWDKNRRSIYTMLTIAIAAIAAYYGWKYIRDSKRDQLWSGVAEATKLDFAYSAANPIFGEVGRFDDPSIRQYRDYFVQQTAFRAAQSLIAELPEHLAKADLAEIDREIARTKGTPPEPLLIWLAAHKAMSQLDWTKADAYLADLEQRFPNHFLTKPSAYPFQFRDAEKPPDGESDPKKNKSPKLLEAVAGSPVGMARKQIARDREFREQHKKFYEAPPPDPDSKTAVMETSLGTIKIKFYGSKAPKTVENFAKLANEGFYDGLRVHEIVRQGSQQSGPSKVAAEFEVGLPSTRDEDRTKWIPPTDAPTLDWEDSGLSHFPYMISMAQATSGKSSAQRFWINQTDAAQSADGTRVPFGVVVEGREFVDTIANSVLSTEDENRTGRGKPRDNITIVKMRVE